MQWQMYWLHGLLMWEMKCQNHPWFILNKSSTARDTFMKSKQYVFLSNLNRSIQMCWLEYSLSSQLHFFLNSFSDCWPWITQRINSNSLSTTMWVHAAACAVFFSFLDLYMALYTVCGVSVNPLILAPCSGGLPREAHPEVLGREQECVQQFQSCGTRRKFEPRRGQEYGNVCITIINVSFLRIWSFLEFLNDYKGYGVFWLWLTMQYFQNV